VRIRGRRLRYALEFLEPAYGQPARKLIDALTAVQDVLGRHQDDQVSMALLRELSEETALPGSARQAIGEMAQICAARAESLRGDFPRTWRKLNAKRWSRWKQIVRESAGELGAELIRDAKDRLRRPQKITKGSETSS
jgi:CHAD domain-containing protein